MVVARQAARAIHGLRKESEQSVVQVDVGGNVEETNAVSARAALRWCLESHFLESAERLETELRDVLDELRRHVDDEGKRDEKGVVCGHVLVVGTSGASARGVCAH